MLLQACGSDTDDGTPIIGFSYVPELSAVYTPYEPELGSAIPAAARASLESADLPYPPFNTHDIKAIGPDAWRNRDQLVNAGVGGVIFNQLWSTWQPSNSLSLSEPNTFEYDGMIWKIDPVREKQIRWYSARGIKVTAVLFATPEWARPNNTARAGNISIVDPKFIASDNAQDFARFAGMIAKRYNGANGNGRIVNFIIQNEVNSLDWYNPGCGAPASPCTVQDRIQRYSSDFNQAYDRIKQEQSQAHVFFSFDHHFGAGFYDGAPFASAQRFIETLDGLVAPREWRIAYHSYPPDLFNPAFGPHDYPKVTFGNLGVLSGFLRQRFPDKPHAWDIHLTENGLNAGAPSSETSQNQQLSVAVRNVLGTPGINNFVYHRMRDHFNEGSFQPGLHDIEDRPKDAWRNWSVNNLHQSNPKRLASGYEDLPYVRLVRSVHPDIGHWSSTRQAPAGYTAEASFLLLRESLPNTTMLYECNVSASGVTRITNDVSCGGQQSFGPVGYIFDFNNIAGNRLPLYGIEIASGDFILSTSPDEVPGAATLLGYVDATKVLNQPAPIRDLSYFNTQYKTFTPAPAIGSQTGAQQLINSLGDCSETALNCNFLRFAVGADQVNTLRCEVQPQPEPIAHILLTYGNDSFSRVIDVAHAINPIGNTYSIPLPIADDATYASVVLTSGHGAATSHCVVLQSGSLNIGAAEDQAEKNLIQNGGFESPLSDWETCSGTAAFTSDAFADAQAVSIDDGNCVYQEIAIDAGNEYLFSCQARHSGTGNLKFTFAGESFHRLAETVYPVNSAGYAEFTVQETAPPNSAYAVVTFESLAGAGQLDACSVVQVE